MESVHRHRTVPALVVAIAIVLAAAACGGSKQTETTNPTTAAWASGVCTAVTTWQNQMSKLGDSVQSSGLSEQALKAALSSAQAATKTMVNTIKALGKPQTTAGSQAKQSLDTLAAQLQSGAKTIQDAVQSVSGVAGIAAAATTIGNALTSMRTDVQSTVTTLQKLDANGELSRAFKDSSACSSLLG